jgi:hypothetical protein
MREHWKPFTAKAGIEFYDSEIQKESVRIVMKAPRGEITLTLEIDDEGFGCVDICLDNKPGFVEGYNEGEPVFSVDTRPGHQLLVTTKDK